MKSESRVKGYRKGTEDWEAEYNMLLDDGITCAECSHSNKCKRMYGGDDSNTRCQFYPNRFSQK